VVLGRGKKLFGAGAQPARFRLVNAKVGSKGVVAASFVRAGAVETGDFAMNPPTAAELERRERMAREG
jgi:hypothetical protein